MPGRVREFNAIQAAGIAAALGISVPMGLAGKCDRERAAGDELRACGATGSADCLQQMPDDESAGIEVLLGVRECAVKQGLGNRE